MIYPFQFSQMLFGKIKIWFMCLALLKNATLKEHKIQEVRELIRL